ARSPALGPDLQNLVRRAIPRRAGCLHSDRAPRGTRHADARGRRCHRRAPGLAEDAAAPGAARAPDPGAGARAVARGVAPGATALAAAAVLAPGAAGARADSALRFRAVGARAGSVNPEPR